MDILKLTLEWRKVKRARPSHAAAQGRCCFRTSAQDGNVFYCQAEARLELSVIEVDEPHADALLAGILPGTNESANEA
jgi:hypothetical protein